MVQMMSPIVFACHVPRLRARGVPSSHNNLYTASLAAMMSTAYTVPFRKLCWTDGEGAIAALGLSQQHDATVSLKVDRTARVSCIDLNHKSVGLSIG